MQAFRCVFGFSGWQVEKKSKTLKLTLLRMSWRILLSRKHTAGNHISSAALFSCSLANNVSIPPPKASRQPNLQISSFQNDILGSFKLQFPELRPYSMHGCLQCLDLCFSLSQSLPPPRLYLCLCLSLSHTHTCTHILGFDQGIIRPWLYLFISDPKLPLPLLSLFPYQAFLCYNSMAFTSNYSHSLACYPLWQALFRDPHCFWFLLFGEVEQFLFSEKKA